MSPGGTCAPVATPVVPAERRPTATFVASASSAGEDLTDEDLLKQVAAGDEAAGHGGQHVPRGRRLRVDDLRVFGALGLVTGIRIDAEGRTATYIDVSVPTSPAIGPPPATPLPTPTPTV